MSVWIDGYWTTGDWIPGEIYWVDGFWADTSYDEKVPLIEEGYQVLYQGAVQVSSLGRENVDPDCKTAIDAGLVTSTRLPANQGIITIEDALVSCL